MRTSYIFRLLMIVLPLVACRPTEQPDLSSPTSQMQSTTDAIEPTWTQTLSPPSEKSIPTKTVSSYEVRRYELVSNSLIPWGIEDMDVIRAMQTVPRHLFVPEAYVEYAYLDMPLPIGHGQTISQPFMVAWMTQLLELEPGDKVLEIGTGSGYQAAVLAELGYVEVYSIEIVPALAEQGRGNLQNAGYDSVYLKEADGYYGWEEYAPFDAIIVTAAPDHLPLPLVNQLSDDGFMVIPIGPPGWYQTLWRVMKVNGEVVAENLGPVAFVPFTGEGVSSEGSQPGEE